MAEKNGVRVIMWAMGLFIAVIIIPGMTFIGKGVIANDRIRAGEDDKLRTAIETVKDDVGEKLEEILIKLTRVEEKLSN